MEQWQGNDVNNRITVNVRLSISNVHEYKLELSVWVVCYIIFPAVSLNMENNTDYFNYTRISSSGKWVFNRHVISPHMVTRWLYLV